MSITPHANILGELHRWSSPTYRPGLVIVVTFSLLWALVVCVLDHRHQPELKPPVHLSPPVQAISCRLGWFQQLLVQMSAGQCRLSLGSTHLQSTCELVPMDWPQTSHHSLDRGPPALHFGVNVYFVVLLRSRTPSIVEHKPRGSSIAIGLSKATKLFFIIWSRLPIFVHVYSPGRVKTITAVYLFAVFCFMVSSSWFGGTQFCQRDDSSDSTNGQT